MSLQGVKVFDGFLNPTVDEIICAKRDLTILKTVVFMTRISNPIASSSLFFWSWSSQSSHSDGYNYLGVKSCQWLSTSVCIWMWSIRWRPLKISAWISKYLLSVIFAWKTSFASSCKILLCNKNDFWIFCVS